MLGRIASSRGCILPHSPPWPSRPRRPKARNYAAAKGWYDKAAALGNTGAMQKIAALYEKGTGKAGAKR